MVRIRRVMRKLDKMSQLDILVKDLAKSLKDNPNRDCQSVENKKIQAFEVRNLYVDTDSNADMTKGVIQAVKALQCAYAYALHDKDFYIEDTFDEHFNLLGHAYDLKKQHYHIYVVLNSPMTIGDIALRLNIKQSQVDKFNPKHFRNKILYLTHITYVDGSKYIYEPNIIETNKKEYVDFVYSSYLPKKPFYDVLNDYMDKHEDIISKNKAYSLARETDNIQDYIKTYSVYKDLINENNACYDNKSLNKSINRLRIEYDNLLEKFKQLEKDSNKLMNERELLDKIGFVHTDDGQTIYAVDNKKGKGKK